MSSFRRRLMSGGKKKEYIKFEDPEVERICIANWSSDGVGLTYEDAERVTDLGTAFKGNTSIVSFNELEYFTNVVNLNNTFVDCVSLSSINLKNIQVIYYAFANCSNLNIDVNIPNLEKIKGGFYNSGIISVSNLGNVKILESTSGSGIGCFQNCKNLKSVNIPNVLEIIGQTFLKCQIEEIVMPNVEIIGNAAFKNTKLTGNLNLPKLKTLGYSFLNCNLIRVENLGLIDTIPNESGSGKGCFSGNANLEFVNIPETVTSVGNFIGCDKLITIISNPVNPPSMLTNRFFNTTPTELKIYVPDESVEAYKQADRWSQYADKIKPLSEYTEN